MAKSNIYSKGGSNRPFREEEASKRELKNSCRLCNKAEYSKEHRCEKYLQFRSYFEKRQDGRVDNSTAVKPKNLNYTGTLQIQNKAIIRRKNNKRVNNIKKKKTL